MAGGTSRHPWYTRIGRKVRLDYLRILRTQGAPSQVARGVGYGIFVELIFFPTLGLAFFLMYPLNKLGKGHMGAAVAGFVFAKLFAFLTIPPSFILGSKILGLRKDYKSFFMDGEKMKPLGKTWEVVKELAASGDLLKALAGWTAGAAVFGAVIGLLGFFMARAGLRKYQARRKARREQLLAEKEQAEAATA